MAILQLIRKIFDNSNQRSRATRFRDACKSLGLADEKIATAWGISRGTLQNYFSGRTSPPMEILVKWQELTGASLDWLAAGPQKASSFSAVERSFDGLPEEVKAATRDFAPWRDRLVFSLPDPSANYPVIDVGERSVYAKVIGSENVQLRNFAPSEDLGEVDPEMTKPYQTVASSGRPYVHEYSCSLTLAGTTQPRLVRTVVVLFPVRLASVSLLASLSLPELASPQA